MHAARALAKWRRTPLVALMEDVLAHAALLREANVLSQRLGIHVSFQYTIMRPFPYGIAESATQGMLAEATDIRGAEISMRLPAVVVRVIDYVDCRVAYWTLERFSAELLHLQRLWAVRKTIPSSFARPRLISESSSPFTHIASATIPLYVLTDGSTSAWRLPMRSLFNGAVLGTCNASLSGTHGRKTRAYLHVDSLALRDTAAFIEVHLQVDHAAFSGDQAQREVSVSRRAAPSEAYSTLALDAEVDIEPGACTAAWHAHGCGVIALFARATPAFFASVELDEVERELGVCTDLAHLSGTTSRGAHGRVHEREHRGEQMHGVHASVRLVEDGAILPVRSGTRPYFTICGGERHFSITLRHESAEQLVWTLPVSASLDACLVDVHGSTVSRVPHLIPLSIAHVQRAAEHTGTCTLKFDAVWGLDACSDALLTEPTPRGYCVAIELHVLVAVHDYKDCIQIAVPGNVRVHDAPRTSFSRVSLRTSLEALFLVRLSPRRCRSAAELWRIDTRRTAVPGQEILGAWVPRGLLLVADLLQSEAREDALYSACRMRGRLKSKVRAHVEENEDTLARARDIVSAWPRSDALGRVRGNLPAEAALGHHQRRASERQTRQRVHGACRDRVPRTVWLAVAAAQLAR